jgi:FixJ family two-component response regulator
MKPTVYVVDDSPSVRRSLTRLLRSHDFEPRCFAFARDFLALGSFDEEACLVLDVQLPDLDGLELQRRLGEDGPPVVFITGHGDIPMSVRAMKAGAVDFLPKPFAGDQLIAAVESALTRGRSERTRRDHLAILRQRFERLTPREREVLEHVARGQANKNVAADLGTAEKTIKVHRARVMAKMEADSLADLVRMSIDLGLAHEAAPDSDP